MARSSSASNVAHVWAHQQKNSMSRNNVFFSGTTIYSYGHHFPIAMLLDGGYVLFTNRRYSNTTARHIRYVRDAVSHKNLIFCWHVPDDVYGNVTQDDHDKNIKAWTSDVKDKLDEIVKAKQQRTKDRLMGELNPIQAEAKVYIEHFNVKLTAAQKKQLFTVDIAGYTEGVRKAEAAAKRKQAALVKKGKELHPVWLEAWRNFKESDFWETADASIRKAIGSVEFEGRDGNWTRLRTIDGVVYSSKNIKLPVDVAYRYYRKYLAVVKAGGCAADNCNYKMLEFSVTEMTAEHLVVGCHDIARSEIDYIAGVLGWAAVPGSYVMSVDEKGNIIDNE
jgi:hypothetical protein